MAIANGTYFVVFVVFGVLFPAPHPGQIYWMHRTLHTNKFLYKYVHALHHKYNTADTLSPWASIAFNPLDGCLQVAFLGRCIVLVCPFSALLLFVHVLYNIHE